jgi:hypothetical protein
MNYLLQRLGQYLQGNSFAGPVLRVHPLSRQGNCRYGRRSGPLILAMTQLLPPYEIHIVSSSSSFLKKMAKFLFIERSSLKNRIFGSSFLYKPGHCGGRVSERN